METCTQIDVHICGGVKKRLNSTPSNKTLRNGYITHLKGADLNNVGTTSVLGIIKIGFIYSA